MPKYNPYKFQQNAIDELVETFKKLWQNPEPEKELLFKSPTGSGKTFMVTSFVNLLNIQPDFQNEDIAFVWITFSDELAMQSKDKFYEYFFPNLSNQLLTVEDFGKGVLSHNDILFINWQKLVSKKASDRKFRRPDDETRQKEQGFYWEDILEKTHQENRKIVLIIDESHKNVTESAYRDVIKPIDPPIIIKVSATPEKEPTASDLKHNKAGFVEVERKDVVEAGLIKEEIITQTEDDLNQYTTADHDTLLLDLAIEKRAIIAEEWKRLGKNINPLVLIQLPNDEKKIKDTDVRTKEQVVTEYLTQAKRIDKSKIAYWFDNRKENMDNIADPDNAVEYMLFKQTAGTGWDCPRAHIMVMYREIKSNTFRTQTLGRILRMPVHNMDLSAYPALRIGYLYTNYKRNEVQNPEDKHNPNVAKTKTAKMDATQKISLATKNLAVSISKEIKKSITIQNESDKQKIADTVQSVVKSFVDKAKTISDIATNEKNPIVQDTKIAQNKIEIGTQIKEELKRVVADTPTIQWNDDEGADFLTNITDIIDNAVNTVADKLDADLVLDPKLISDYIARTDYGDIGKVSTFQEHFIKSMNSFFSISDNQTDDEKRQNLEAKGLKLDTILEIEVIVNARFRSDTDGSDNELGKNIKFEESDNDVEKEFSWKCYEKFETLPAEYKIGNVARSWGPFKEALRQWFDIAMNYYTAIECYKVFLNDISKEENSILGIAVNNAFKEYKPVLEEFQRKKAEAEEAKLSKPFIIKTKYAVPDDYEEYQCGKSIIKPFMLPKNYSGKKNETDFIKYLDSKYESIEWWFKNGVGKEYLAFKYYDEQDQKDRLFYPDWIIKFKSNRIGIFDTKGGFTADEVKTKYKNEELQRRIKDLNNKSQYKYIGGIVISDNGIWKYNNSDLYNPNNKDDWKDMNEIF